MELKDRVGRLTERQRECLRLVGSGFSVKDAADRLKLSVDTVDYHLRNARQTLGVNRSTTAARVLSEHEDLPPGSSVGSSSVVEPSAPLRHQHLDEGTPSASVLAEGRDGRSSAMFGELVRAPLPTTGRRDNDLTWRGKLFWGLLTALILMAIVGGLRGWMA